MASGINVSSGKCDYPCVMHGCMTQEMWNWTCGNGRDQTWSLNSSSKTIPKMLAKRLTLPRIVEDQAEGPRCGAFCLVLEGIAQKSEH